MTTDDPHVIRTGKTDWSQAYRGRHPFNPASEMRMVAIGSASGLKRLGVNLIRIPPGKESFIPHAHTLSEEFAFVLEGQGEAVLDGVAHAIGPGDFVGFPCDGVVHSLRCTGPDDLVYLTAGEGGRTEIADMPTIGKTAVFRNGGIELYGEDGVERLTQAEWMARTKIED
jgi:uncharacterized cupin superfamily protein